MQTNTINSDNWTYCHYSSAQNKALITFGASAESMDQSYEYYVTVLNNDHDEVFQKEFNQLDMACRYINQRYQKIWKFVDATRPVVNESGCSTCIAH